MITVVFVGQGKKYSLEWLRYENEESDCQYSVYAQKYEINYVAQNEHDLKFRFTCIAGEGMTDKVIIYIKDLGFNLGFWLWEQCSGYYEYITLNNKVYRKVQKLVVTHNSINNRLYYNFDFGIIRIELDYLNEKYQLID